MSTKNETPEIPGGTPPEFDSYGCDNGDDLDIHVCSSMECTGLIPALPHSDSDLESYAEVYHYPADIFQD